MVRRIVKQFHPEKMILFGSHARGEAGPDSDVDLLVVMPVDGSKREKQLEVRLALHDIPASKDIIVTTPGDFESRRKLVGTIEYPEWDGGTQCMKTGCLSPRFWFPPDFCAGARSHPSQPMLTAW